MPIYVWLKPPSDKPDYERGHRTMTTLTRGEPPSSSQSHPGLRKNALGFPTVLAQSIALISPTMTAVLIIALCFGDAGNGTWLAYAFGTVMLLFVVGCLNQFAKRSALAGSMYGYTGRGLGPTSGVISGFSLIWAYLFIGVAGLTGFSIFAAQFLSGIGDPHRRAPGDLLLPERGGLLVHRLQGHPRVVAAHAGVRVRVGGLHPEPGRSWSCSSTGSRSTPPSSRPRA